MGVEGAPVSDQKASDLDRVAEALRKFMPVTVSLDFRRELSIEAARDAIAALEDR
jgi:hypothetical protein